MRAAKHGPSGVTPIAMGPYTTRQRGEYAQDHYRHRRHAAAPDPEGRGVEYLFTNPGSAETGIFAALAESEEQRLVVGKHEGLVAAMADGYHRISGKVGVVIAHVMGGSYQLAGQLFNAQNAGSSLLVVAGTGRPNCRIIAAWRRIPV